MTTTTEPVPARLHQGGRYWFPLPLTDRLRGAADGRHHEAVGPDGAAPTMFLRGLERGLRHRAHLQRLRVERRMRPVLREQRELHDRANDLLDAVDAARSATGEAATEAPERDRMMTAVERAAGISEQEAADRRARERAARVDRQRSRAEELERELRGVLRELQTVEARLAGEWALHRSAVLALEDLLNRRGLTYARAYVRLHRRASDPDAQCACDAIERWTGAPLVDEPVCPWLPVG